MVNVCVMYYSKILKVTRIILFFGLSSSVNLAEEDNIVISYIVNYEEIKPLVEKLFGDWKKGKLFFIFTCLFSKLNFSFYFYF